MSIIRYSFRQLLIRDLNFHWENSSGSEMDYSADQLEYFLASDTSKIKAVFKEVRSPLEGLLVINEVSGIMN